MSEQWPPGWADPDDDTEPDAAAEARQSEVTAYLSAVPAPALPDAVEARITAALAAEAAAAGAGGPEPLPARPGRRRRHRGAPRARRGLLTAVGTLAACLILIVVGFTLSRGGPQQESGAASSAASEQGQSSGSSAAAGGSVPAPKESAFSFAVTTSGTRYLRATLAEQVRATIGAKGGTQSGFAQAAAGPDTVLRGCVLHLTGGTRPRLVDRATYQGKAAYVIATSARVWVTEPGCTAAHPELIVSVPLAGLSGNLRALVSVEQRALTRRHLQ